MSDANNGLGGRLPLADPAALDEAQRALYDKLNENWVAYAKTIGVEAATQQGRLIGPFNPLLLHPEVAQKLWDLQIAESQNTTLPPRLREVIVILTGAIWRADYELYAQLTVGRKSGLSDAAIASLSAGKIPDDLSADERLAARLARDLATNHRVDDALYREAEQAFGAKGLFDITAVMGVYQTVCSMMALFEVPAPE